MRLTDPQIIEYLRKELDKGFTQQQIIAAMAKAGYNEDSVKETLTWLQDNTPEPIPKHTDNPNLGEVPQGMFKRSWYLFKLCWYVMRRDGELFTFTILGAVLSILFVAAIIIPAVLGLGIVGASESMALFNTAFYFILFGVYVGIAFIKTFFETAIVHTVHTRITGGNPTFRSGMGFAGKRIFRVLQWSLLSATVGLVLYLIESVARRIKGIGSILVSILRSLLGLAWKIISLFAIPAMAIYDEGPITAIKSSIETLKRTWGESLTIGVSLFVIKLIINVTFILVWIGAVFALSSSLTAVLIVSGIMVITLLSSYFIFKTADSVWRTTVFTYAADGTIAQDFPKELIDDALKSEK